MIGLSRRTQIRWEAQSFALLLRVGKDHPTVLWHYLTTNLRYLLVKFGVLFRARKNVTEVRTEFEAEAAKGRFKELWFDTADAIIVLWCVTFAKVFDRADPVRILEIGSWEGRSTLFLLAYFRQGHLTAVDTWAGSEYHHYRDLQGLEARFDGNLAPFASRLTKRKGASVHVLAELLDEQQKFDVIYVDGSHFADDVLTDAISAWRLLEQGGLLIFDDFLWPGYPRARANPAWAINVFLKYRKGEYKILNVYSQLILQKKVAFTDRAAAELSALR